MFSSPLRVNGEIDIALAFLSYKISLYVFNMKYTFSKVSFKILSNIS